MQQDGNLTFTIPLFEDALFKAQAKIVEAQSTEEYRWIGKLIDGVEGDISVVSDPQAGTCAYVDLINRTYTIFPLGGNLGVLTKVTHQVDAVVCSLTEPPENTEIQEFCGENPSCSEGVVDVLVLVTDEARDFFADFNPLLVSIYVNLGFASVDAALSNSGITDKKVRFRSVAFDFNDYTTSLSDPIRKDTETLEALPEAQSVSYKPKHRHFPKNS